MPKHKPFDQEQRNQLNVAITMRVFEELNKHAPLHPTEIAHAVARLFVGLIVAMSDRKHLTRLEVRDQMTEALHHLFDQCWDHFASHHSLNDYDDETAAKIKDLMRQVGAKPL